MMGSKHIDPALCIYIGAYLICIDNKHLTDKVPRGNGTICRVLGFKMKENAQSYQCKNYYGKKVWTVRSSSVNNSLLLQMCPVAELSHTQKDESVSNDESGSKVETSAIVVCARTVKACTHSVVLRTKKL